MDNISNEQLQLYIERIENLLEEKKNISNDIKDVFTEAKSTGYIPKIMKEIIKIRAKDKNSRMEEEALIEVYKNAIGIE